MDKANSQGCSRSVLVVEDNEKNARLVLAILEAGGYSAQFARDGAEGLHRAQEIKPDLIITDLQMPVLDGLQMTRALKAIPDMAQIPIVALSAHALDEHRQSALEAGCCGFLVKPVRFQTLLDEVAIALEAPRAIR